MRQLLNLFSIPADVEEVVTLGLHHEQQHQELLITDLKYIFGHNPIFPVYKEGFSLTEVLNNASGFASILAGVYEIGFTGEGFCYDNELGRHKVYLDDFEISKALVTNGEYLDFINDGGYQRFDLWLDEGWQWVNSRRVEAPLYWHKIDGQWRTYTLGGLQKINPDSVLCHINFYEAAAFAEWKGMRLPTEFEWEIAATQLNWGQRWEWTHSAYLPYPKFSKAPGAIGEYNGKFMINQMVLRGGSTATSPDHSRATYRNFFHPHLQWQCTGIRLIR
jgi:ergothioneine biosynthesis protein EgtB